jgi:transcriptional regulator with XRE-family HTH domain
MSTISPLEQARHDKGWTRQMIEDKTEGRVSISTLERWEKGKHKPNTQGLEVLCNLYGKTPEEVGFGQNRVSVIMGSIISTPTIEETPIMSDTIRRMMLGNLGTKLTGLVGLWPKRNYYYEDLQAEIHRTVIDYNAVVALDPTTYEQTRRDALHSMALIPLELIGGLAMIEKGQMQKTDTDVLLKYVASGIAGCWYLRRGRDLAFVNDLTSTYIALLRPLIHSQSDAHRRASATLLSQCFRLKGDIIKHLDTPDSAIPYYHDAIHYALLAENQTEQAITNRVMSLFYEQQGMQGYKQALDCAQSAYGLLRKDTPKLIHSFIASGLSLMSAVNGKTDEARHMLAEAYNLFDPSVPIPSVLYTESNLLAISAHVSEHCGQWVKAIGLCEKSLTTPNTSSALGSVQRRIQYAKTEVSRDDKPRNMDLCTKLLSEAVTGAKELNSKLFIREARACYNLLRVAWPREQAIKALGREHFGVTG